MKKADFIDVGHIKCAHGLRGETLVFWKSGDCPVNVPPGRIYLGAEHSSEYKIEALRSSDKGDIVRLAGIDDRTKAEDLKGKEIFARHEDLKPLKQGEYYSFQLVGLEVESDEGTRVGVLEEIVSTPAHDIYIVKKDSGDEIMLPAVEDIVKKIDLENKKIIIHLIEGLVGLNK